MRLEKPESGRHVSKAIMNTACSLCGGTQGTLASCLNYRWSS